MIDPQREWHFAPFYTIHRVIFVASEGVQAVKRLVAKGIGSDVSRGYKPLFNVELSVQSERLAVDLWTNMAAVHA